MAISAWHHNSRLAREENDSAHKQLMAKYGGFDDWVRQYARWFAEDVNTYREYSENNNNIMMVRYEDMISDKRDSLCKIFGFLGADDGADIIGSIVNRSDLAAMRKESSNPDFFRSATTDMGTGVISKQLGSDINEIAGEALQYLGYDIKHQ